MRKPKLGPARRARQVGVVLLTVLGLGLLGLAGSGSASAGTRAYCGLTWGSLPETAESYAGPPVVAARAGRHTCWDRMVFDLRGAPPGYDVRYVSLVRQDGSGAPVPVAGGATLQIHIHAPAYDANYRATLPVRAGASYPAVAGFRTFRQSRYAGSFEGRTTFALGVRARLPFRVFTLPGPGSGSRLVVDVAHFW